MHLLNQSKFGLFLISFIFGSKKTNLNSIDRVEEQVAQTRLDAAAFKQLAQVAERIDGFEVCVPGR